MTPVRDDENPVDEEPLVLGMPKRSQNSEKEIYVGNLESSMWRWWSSGDPIGLSTSRTGIGSHLGLTHCVF